MANKKIIFYVGREVVLVVVMGNRRKRLPNELKIQSG
jgi:hypothetical protein